jgi:hypothetical protein
MVACGVLVGIASFGLAMEPVAVYNIEGMPDPYAGPTPSGMRFGDIGQVVSMQTGDVGGYGGGPGCPNCGFGVSGTPCDPCWRGPCIDWKLIGWYSNWHDKQHGCGHSCRCRCGGTCCY